MSEAADPSTAREDARPEGAAPDKALSPAALRALAEAAERRARAAEAERAPERGGAQGPEPTRFGDWERKGVAVDF
jgi:hypothetical protein